MGNLTVAGWRAVGNSAITLARNAFNILEKATDAIERRLRLQEVVSR